MPPHVHILRFLSILPGYGINGWAELFLINLVIGLRINADYLIFHRRDNHQIISIDPLFEHKGLSFHFSVEIESVKQAKLRIIDVRFIQNEFLIVGCGSKVIPGPFVDADRLASRRSEKKEKHRA